MKYSTLLLMLFFTTNVLAQSTDTRINDKQSQSEVKITEILKSSKAWDGSPLPSYPTKNPEITILSYEIPAQTRLPMHKHPVINAGVALQGKLIVHTKAGKQLILNQGDSIVELVDKWHFGENQGDIPVKLLMFYVGEVGVPLAIKEED